MLIFYDTEIFISFGVDGHIFRHSPDPAKKGNLFIGRVLVEQRQSRSAGGDGLQCAGDLIIA
jgi:hypothetical protein